MAAGDNINNPNLRRTPMVDVNGVAGHRHTSVQTAPAVTLPDLTAVRALASAVVPRTRNPEFAAYYRSTDIKHFGDRTEPGSKFTDPGLNCIEDVVALAVVQRGSLDGDDREEFIARGADPAAFQAGNRYLFVRTPGTIGVIDTAGMDRGTVLSVLRTKPGAPCSLVLDVDQQPDTDYGVIILGDDEGSLPVVITVFPGLVTPSTKHDDIEAREGGTILLCDARVLLGGDIWVNTRLS